MEDEEEEGNIDRDELVNPAWIEDPRLGNGEVKQMGEREIQFFQVRFYRSFNSRGVYFCRTYDAKSISTPEIDFVSFSDLFIV